MTSYLASLFSLCTWKLSSDIYFLAYILNYSNSTNLLLKFVSPLYDSSSKSFSSSDCISEFLFKSCLSNWFSYSCCWTRDFKSYISWKEFCFLYLVKSALWLWRRVGLAVLENLRSRIFWRRRADFCLNEGSSSSPWGLCRSTLEFAWFVYGLM
jgi:hypothetical protein